MGIETAFHKSPHRNIRVRTATNPGRNNAWSWCASHAQISNARASPESAWQLIAEWYGSFDQATVEVVTQQQASQPQRRLIPLTQPPVKLLGHPSVERASCQGSLERLARKLNVWRRPALFQRQSSCPWEGPAGCQ
jgi:hypothetical protein